MKTTGTSLVHPDHLPQVIEHIQKRFTQSGEDPGIEYRKVRKDGSVHWINQRVRLDNHSRGTQATGRMP